MDPGTDLGVRVDSSIDKIKQSDRSLRGYRTNMSSVNRVVHNIRITGRGSVLIGESLFVVPEPRRSCSTISGRFT